MIENYMLMYIVNVYLRYVTTAIRIVSDDCGRLQSKHTFSSKGSKIKKLLPHLLSDPGRCNNLLAISREQISDENNRNPCANHAFYRVSIMTTAAFYTNYTTYDL